MEPTEVLKKVNEIFVDVLDDVSIRLDWKSTAEDVEGWDSLTNIHLVVTIEKEFGIRFTAKEIQSWTNVGEMVDAVCKRLAVQQK